MEKDARSITLPEWQEVFPAMGEKKFRAGQVYRWIHQRGAESFDEMTDLPGTLREKLKKEFFLDEFSLVRRQVSALDGTEKYLFRLSDASLVESVLMRYHHGISVCISSQVGCNMGCAFCASTIGGKLRNLTAGEMLGQVYRIQKETGERVSHVVVMGTGEPLDNYDNLVRFIEMISGEEGLHISQRNLTVSTCGIVPNMRKLADGKFQITLALSLHASSQEKREKLMPVARKYRLGEVLEACDYYFRKTGRRITYEYAMVSGENTSKADAERLIAMLGHKNCHINLIPVNPVKERTFTQPDKKEAAAFCDRLLAGGINATIRRSMGRDIDGACGQLRRRQMEEGEEL